MASTFRRRRTTTNDDDRTTTTTTAADDATAAVTSTSKISSTMHHKLAGTKPSWTSGSVVTSTGLRELDNILSGSMAPGGQPLGTCIYLDDDMSSLSKLSWTILQYWCAEALSQEQELLIPTDDFEDSDGCEQKCRSRHSMDVLSEDCCSTTTTTTTTTKNDIILELLHSLPRNLHKDKQEANKKKEESLLNNNQDDERRRRLLGTLDEVEEEDNDNNDNNQDDDDDGLVVAWQYRKDVQQERLGLLVSSDDSSSRRTASDAAAGNTTRPAHGTTAASTTSSVYCYSYDLQGRLCDQMNVQEAATIVPMSGCGRNGCTCSFCCGHKNKRHCGFKYYSDLKTQVRKILDAAHQQPHSRRKVVRVLLYHADAEKLAVALPLFLNWIRTEQLPVVVLVSLQSWTISASLSNHLQRTADVVLETENFVARARYPPPPEFRHLHGLLKVRKANTCVLATAVGHFANLTVQKRPAADLYGLKRDRRKLHINLLHIPPEDYAADGGSVGMGAVRSGAGKPPQSSSQALGCASAGGSGNSPLDF